MRNFIFFILCCFTLTANILYPNIFNLQKGQSVYSAQILDENNYAFIIKEYKNTFQNSGYFYSIYYNDSLVSTFKEVKYYTLNNNTSISLLAKQSYINRDMWVIKNSLSGMEFLYDEIEHIEYCETGKRALAFMRKNGVGYAVDINGSSINEVAMYTELICSKISHNGSKYAFSIQRDGFNFLVNDGVESLVVGVNEEVLEGELTEDLQIDDEVLIDESSLEPIEAPSIVDIVFSKDGDVVVYKKKIAAQDDDNNYYEQYYIEENTVSVGPYKAIDNISISDDNKLLAYSFYKLPIIELIEDFIEVENISTNLVIYTNMVTNIDATMTNINTNVINNISELLSIENYNGNAVITNVIDGKTNYINSYGSEMLYYNTNTVKEPRYTISYVTNAEIAEYAIIEVDELDSINTNSFSNILTNDIYNFSLYQNVNLTNMQVSVITNKEIITNTSIEIVTNKIVTEFPNEYIMINGIETEIASSISNINFSPDSGTLFYILTDDDDLKSMVVGGIATEGYESISTYRFSDDGSVFAYNADGQTVVNSSIKDPSFPLHFSRFLSICQNTAASPPRSPSCYDFPLCKLGPQCSRWSFSVEGLGATHGKSRCKAEIIAQY